MFKWVKKVMNIGDNNSNNDLNDKGLQSDLNDLYIVYDKVINDKRFGTWEDSYDYLESYEIKNIISDSMKLTSNHPELLLHLGKLNEYQNMQSALSRKLNNLIASRQLALLRAPKLKTLKQTNLTVIDNLQSSINFAIPLWKQQAADAILSSRQQQAIEVQKFMTEQTNKMIVSGANNVRKATLEAQKQSNESFVSASKLTQATDILRDTLVQVQSLQKQGDSLRKQEAKDLLQSGEHMKSVALDLMKNDKMIE